MTIVAAAYALSLMTVASAAYATDGRTAERGRALFERDWVQAPTSSDAADGLGPLFSARSCAACHAGEALAGRFTAAPEGRIASRGLVLRFGDAEGRRDPHYGHALQSQAAPGISPEGRMVLTTASDGAGDYELSLHLQQGPLAPETRQSLRLAPSLHGRALLEQVDSDVILQLADPDDRDGDGISGRARVIRADSGDGLGRYGWKAEIGSLKGQIADAFAMDLGLSSRLRPTPHGDCTERQADCLAAPLGERAQVDGHELSDDTIDLVAAFLADSPLLPRAASNEEGEALFVATGCAACHVPSLTSTRGQPITIYSDLLLHDMGPALNDGVGAPGVASSEWRTAPLIAMQPGNGRRYLHDGRAATIDAAIRAHGGEAAAAQSRYAALDAEARDALVAFVEAL